MNKRKAIGKLGVSMFEFSAMAIDTFALPTRKARVKQERFVRRLYRNANELSGLIGNPKKIYKRINSKGEVEVI